jgi:hypothetical protein
MSKNAQLCVAKKNITTILLPMDNQSTSPQIIFPNVPDDFCPSGNWTEVFQQFIETVLANGTIDVPGLGDVTPAEIQNINSQIGSLQNQANALNTRVTALEGAPTVTLRTGTIAVSSGNSSLNVTFTALPGTDYGVSIQPVGTATTVAAGKYILQAGQTTTGFTILVNDNPATVTTLRWTAIHTS